MIRPIFLTVSYALSVASAGLLTGPASAQSSNGSTATSCTQSGNELTCTTTTKITLPAGANLQSGSVGGGNFQIVSAGSPGCGGLVANPSVATENVATPIALSIAGCAVNSSYTWQAPAAATGTSSSSHNLTLTSANNPQSYSVTVCIPGATTSPGCQTYSASVSLPVPTPTLLGCVIAPSSTSIQTNGSVNLNVSCSQGAGAGSGVTYQWRLNGQNLAGQNSSALVVSGSIGVGTYSYTVSLTNNASQTPVISAASTVNVTAASGNVNWSNCGAITAPARSFTWGTSLYTAWTSGGHPGSTPYVVEIIVPTTPLADPEAALVYAPQSGSGNRQIALSQTTPCDFSQLLPSAGSTKLIIGRDPNNPPSPNGVVLSPGRWYFSFRSAPSTGSNITCGATQTCSMSMQWAP
jgi:hypothetical protein